MFKISNKPNLYKFLVENIKRTETKTMYKETIKLIKKERIFKNTEKLELFLKKNLNFKNNPDSFLFNLSSEIFEFSRRMN
jgi:hypothetical protein